MRRRPSSTTANRCAKAWRTCRTSLGRAGGASLWQLALIVASGLVMLLGGYGFLRLYVADQGARAQVAESQRLEAERQEQEAKRVNDANQAAILRLMNELQTVAEGDLTQQATVTEDITGAIADSVNYTVEELRTLVAQVQGTVTRVTETTQQVESTSTELLAASTEQLREIRDTGESVLQMASRINEVSAQAQQTAQVARQSLMAAETGREAVQNTIGGMNSIRDQIQETSKRIKRLGESSQEIGEITELISDITEQTNVLALNAAIQAASGRRSGPRLQRSWPRRCSGWPNARATRRGRSPRIVQAPSRPTRKTPWPPWSAATQGVVEGARLSDAAGSALGDIDRVTRELSDLIAQHLVARHSREADSANVVAANIQHIFAVTEQTGEGTRSTAQMVRELSRTAEELRASVARFKDRLSRATRRTELRDGCRHAHECLHAKPTTSGDLCALAWVHERTASSSLETAHKALRRYLKEAKAHGRLRRRRGRSRRCCAMARVRTSTRAWVRSNSSACRRAAQLLRASRSGGVSAW